MSRVVVLGGRGFLGRQAVTAFRADPRVEDVLTPGREECDLATTGGDELIRRLRHWRPDVVVNCTGMLDGSAGDLVRANTLVTANLLDALRHVPSRLVRIGSAGEYGPVPPNRPVREDDPASPRSSYGISHLTATTLVNHAAERGEVRGCTLRVFNPIGPHMQGNTVLRRAAERAWAAVHSGEPEIAMGSLEAYRDFVDARDVGAAVVAAAFSDSGRTVYNIGSGRAVSVRDAVHEVVRQTGYVGRIRETSDTGRSAGVDRICADISAATTELGWYPRIDLQDSLARVTEGLHQDRDLVAR